MSDVSPALSHESAPLPGRRLRTDFAWIDVEASSLFIGSWPVSIGWAFDDLTGGFMLVRPEPDWEDWSWESEEIHRLPRRLLMSDGWPAATVADRLNDILGGLQVHSDTGTADGDGGLDLKWLWRLFSAMFSATDRRMKFRVVSEDLAIARQMGLYGDPGARGSARVDPMARGGNTLPVLEEARALACAAWPHTHDAFEDARHLAAGWWLAMDDEFRGRTALYLKEKAARYPEEERVCPQRKGPDP